MKEDITKESSIEGSQDLLGDYSLNLSDAELSQVIDDSIASGMTYHDKLVQIQDKNEKYWKGEQEIGEEMFFDDEEHCKPVENRIFLSLETLIPIVTNRTPEPVLFTDSDNKEQVDALGKILVGKFEEDFTRTEIRLAVRHWALYRLGILKLCYDVEQEDFTTKCVRPQRLVFDASGCTIHEMRYMGEMVQEPLKEVLTKFPKKKNDILIELGLKGDATDLSTQVNYWEFWTNEMVVWKLGDIILEKSLNPFWDYDNEENNFIRRPTKPYAELNRVFSLGTGIYDDTSLAEQTLKVQEGIDHIYKNLFEDLDDRGSMVATGDGISKEEFEKVRNGSGDKIWFGSGVDVRQTFQRLAPKEVNPLSLSLKQELSQQSDNIMGTHGTSRGEQGVGETYRGRQLLKDQDTGRTQPVSDSIERMMTRVYSLWVQAIKVLWTDEKIVSYTDDKGAQELVAFKGSMVQPGLKLRIKPGSLLPKDKFLERNEALELLPSGKIDDETLYEKLGDPNPKETAKKAYMQNAVISGQIMQPGFLDMSELLYPGIKQEVISQLQESGANPQIIMTLMGQPPMPQGGQPGMPQASSDLPPGGLGDVPPNPMEEPPIQLPPLPMG
jgi:hypothetical protein